MKIADVIQKLEEFHPPLDMDRPSQTDCIKFGDEQAECTGIVITIYVTPDVIRKAGELGYNLIICHEPLFYNHRDATAAYQNNQIYQEKVKLLEQYHMTVYRDHDHIHGGGPGLKPEERKYEDGIFYGIMKELEWEDYVVGNRKKPLYYHIPETTASMLAGYICEKFHLNGVRILGDPDSKVKSVYFCEHVSERKDDDIIHNTDEQGIDCLIPLEIIDWTVSEYIRDSVGVGRPRAILELGHFNVEEGGMRFMEKWLPRAVGNEIPVKFVQAGDDFHYINYEA